MPFFLGGKPRGAFGQPVFSLACLAKRFSWTEVKFRPCEKNIKYL